jgi:hypothetical protein
MSTNITLSNADKHFFYIQKMIIMKKKIKNIKQN